MNYPQTRAETIGKYGCLAMCYLYCLGIIPDNPAQMISLVSKAIDEDLLDGECTVKDASKFLEHFSGRKFDVAKKAVTSIRGIREATPVRYDFEGKSHWVVVENGKIVFNSIINSRCVAKGKPTTARVITLKQRS